ncbi:MAG TPA: hypothetical protein VFW46_20125 [Stellaceae bacterium]|nr:hypothetical protein [Stellaceae bacterium]
MRSKVRHIDLHGDEFLAAISGEMTPSELGVYWMINLLCYNRRKTIRYDLDWIRAKFRPHKGNREIGAIVERLIAGGRVFRDGDEIGVRRALEEVQTATRRIRDAVQYGRRGGRPKKKNNDLEKGSGLKNKKGVENLTTNHQPPTTRLETDAVASVVGASAPDPATAPGKRKSDGARKARLPADWRPDLGDCRYAAERQHDRAWIADQAERFRDHHTARQTLSADWRASWRTWVRNAEEFAARDHRRPSGGAGGAAQSGGIAAAMHSVLSRRDVG